MTEVRPGDPTRLGPTPEAAGSNFAVYSDAAARGATVSLCLLGDDGSEEQLPMRQRYDVWACNAAGIGHGRRYGFRVSDRPGLLLADPYARAMTPDQSLVVDDPFDWGDDAPPDREWSDTILYETHVKGISMRHPGVPPELRGTFAGLASEAVLDHLVSLGATAVELMPVQQFRSEGFLRARGLTNYWGYNTIGFFAPHHAYSSSGTAGQQVREFKAMVKALHARGLEVILDVVYNHTAEGAPNEPPLSFRGLAGEAYYREVGITTGTPNALDTGALPVLRLVTDSLRYWVQEMHVDGFRFDLAAELARQHGSVDRLSSFFALLYQDPVLSHVKLIAEPWDVDAIDSYQVGQFPPGWQEWNDKYRDEVRRFWRGDAGIGALASRLAGSSDVYGATRRGPDASVNFVVAHDGKTLTDVVTYVGKYNQANGEDNHDGPPDDKADNCGVEGPTNDPAVLARRARRRRNLLATLLVSQGTSMIAGGDELGRTQRGNSNAYCQDNEISWYDWDLTDADRALLAFTRRAIALQLAHPALRRRSFLTGVGDPLSDVMWFAEDGTTMTEARWRNAGTRFLGALLAGDAVGNVDATASPEADGDVLIAVNAGGTNVEVSLPGRPGALYTVELDTGADDGIPSSGAVPAGARLLVPAQTVIVAMAPLGTGGTTAGGAT
jgi:isoamylase